MTGTKPLNAHATSAEQKPLTVSQRAIAAARLLGQFAPDAKKRQRAGTRAPKSIKGKSAAKAAAQFGVSTRAVELVTLVLDRGVPQLVELLAQDRVSIRVAAKLASQQADRYTTDRRVQQWAVEEIAAGRPVAEALAATGVQERESPSFDDEALTKAITRLRKQLDRRAAAFGTCDAYWQTRDELGLVSRAVRRWRERGYDAPVPVIFDPYGRRAPESVAREFQIVEEIKIVCGQFDALAKQVEGLTRRPGGKLIQTQLILPRLKEARKILWDAQPVHVCPFCSGPTCEFCHGLGWTPAEDWKPVRGGDEPTVVKPPPQPVPPPVPDVLPTPVRAEAPAAKPAPTKRLCPICRQHGFPWCPDCMLAFDPGLVRGRDGCLYRVKATEVPDGRVVSWPRCAVCNDPYQWVGPPFRNPPMCNNCLPG